MSSRTSAAVFDLANTDKSSLLMTLAALADQADDEGCASIHLPVIAAKARKSAKQARRDIKALERMGELIVVRTSGGVDEYKDGAGAQYNANLYVVLTGLSGEQIEKILLRRVDKKMVPRVPAIVAGAIACRQAWYDQHGDLRTIDPDLVVTWQPLPFVTESPNNPPMQERDDPQKESNPPMHGRVNTPTQGRVNPVTDGRVDPDLTPNGRVNPPIDGRVAGESLKESLKVNSNILNNKESENPLCEKSASPAAKPPPSPKNRQAKKPKAEKSEEPSPLMQAHQEMFMAFCHALHLDQKMMTAGMRAALNKASKQARGNGIAAAKVRCFREYWEEINEWKKRKNEIVSPPTLEALRNRWGHFGQWYTKRYGGLADVENDESNYPAGVYSAVDDGTAALRAEIAQLEAIAAARGIAV